MPIVWLKYVPAGGVAVARRYNALTGYEREVTEGEIRRTLADVDIENISSYRGVYDLGIGADELAVPDAYTFLKAWHRTPDRWLCFDASATEPVAEDFVAVSVPPGAIPVEFEGGNKHLPVYSAVATEKRSRI